MSLTVTQRPNQSGVWVMAKNPVIYKMTRKDFTWTTLVTSGGNTSIQIATNVTASFVAGDTIWLQSDDGAYSASGTVVSSAFGAATTVITTVPYVANNAAGYINIISRRPNYYVGVAIYRATLNTLIGTVNYYPTTVGLLTIDISSVLLSVLDPSLPAGIITEGFINDSTAYQGFYIKYTEFWTGSGNSATDDVANISYGVIGANQIGQSGYATEGFLTKQDRFKITGSDWYGLSFLDQSARTSVFLGKNWYSGSQLLVSTFVQSSLTPAKQIYSYFQKLISASTLFYRNELVYHYINASSGTSWTLIPGGGMLVTLATGTNSKAGLGPCFIPTGSTINIDWSVGNNGSNCNIDITFRDVNGLSVNTSSVLSTSSALTEGITTITAVSDIYYVGFIASNSSGSNRTFTILSARVLIPNTISRVDVSAFNIPAALPFASTNFTNAIISDVVCSQNPITLFWRNSQGGESSWTFGYAQDQVQKLQDPQKNKWLTLYEQNLTLSQFNALNELFSVNQVYQTPIIELTTSVDKTEARIGQQVYTVDSSGNKIGVIVIGGENKTRTRNNKHQFQVTIELPEIFG